MITSVGNEYIKKIVKLKDIKNIKEVGKYLIEGEHLVKEALKNNLLIEIITTDENMLNETIKSTLVSSEVMKKISNLKSIPKVVGVCKTFETKDIKGNRILILDNILDPGNLGTIIRCCSAFNIDTIIMGDDCVSVYNDKVLRSTQGLHFYQNIVRDNLIDAIPKLKDEGYDILVTSVNNGEDIRRVKPSKFALVVGNEGQGVKSDIMTMASKLVNIKMNKQCESLNVAIATAICLYELDNG